MDFLGCDDSQLRQLGEQLVRYAERMDEQIIQIGHAVRLMPWDGPDAEQFRREYESFAHESSAKTVQKLAKMGHSAIQNAAEQALASSADGQFDDASMASSKPLSSTEKSGTLIDIPGHVKSQVDDPTEIRRIALRTKQGDMGDCYLLGSLIAVAEKDPDFIDNNIWFSGGKYHVRLYETNWRGDVHETIVDVDPVAAENGAKDGADQMSWVTVYEAAYAKHMGGYGKIESGGRAENALQTITGWKAETYDNEPSFPEIREELDHGNVVVADTTRESGEPFLSPQSWVDRDGPVPHDTVATHQYAVTGFTTDGKIVMQNPWGITGNPSDPDFKPHELILTESEYRERFENVTIARR